MVCCVPMARSLLVAQWVTDVAYKKSRTAPTTKTREIADACQKWALQNMEVDEEYDAYVAVKPINLWLDMEVFAWNGYPKSKEELEANSPRHLKSDGIVDYQIDYIRVWQTNPKGTAD